MAKHNHKHEKIYRDGFQIQTHVALPLIDRLRILFGAKSVIRTEIMTENLCGRSQTNSTFIIEKIFPENIQKIIDNFRGKDVTNQLQAD